ncbi:hypothetical protein [Thiomicrospira sp. WB1]|uniref:hypothetical protein n=1 Tax=Thiomicrospira sp. WB1 TaxID=1685380 RepID=UPI000747EF15|nr:hypothetical protein [Thiomicrospira sp. WB1]KUJ71319.1 hypothetical protein AVO41_07220 [Thiomicrospira sp. WB1]
MIDFIKRQTGWLLLVTLGFLSGCSSQNDAPTATAWPMMQSCELRESVCTAQAPKELSLAQVPGQAPITDQRVTLSLSPRPVQVARSLEASARLEGFADDAIKSVEIDVAGINMYMGYNRVPLQRQSPGHYTGPLMLAFCTNDEMHWQVTVLITLNDGHQIQVPFQLTTYNQQSD